MKARVKDTVRLLKNIVPVMSIDDKLIMFHENGTDDDYYYFEQLDFNDVIDWDQIHIQTAIAAMHAELSNPNNKFMACEDKQGIIVRRAVRYADALTDKLKKGGKE